MLTYGQLDAVADANNPLLGVVCLLRFIWLLSRKNWNISGRMALFFCCALIVAYGWEKIDIRFAIWPRTGLDYSTHTAVAVAATTVLWLFWRRGRIAWISWLFAYAVLMLWQQYHSAADIVTTAGVVICSILPFWRMLCASKPVQTASSDASLS
jgi:hypothetical protein